jgi:hypothetical protein
LSQLNGQEPHRARGTDRTASSGGFAGVGAHFARRRLLVFAPQTSAFPSRVLQKITPRVSRVRRWS